LLFWLLASPYFQPLHGGEERATSLRLACAASLSAAAALGRLPLLSAIWCTPSIAVSTRAHGFWPPAPLLSQFFLMSGLRHRPSP